MHCDRAFTIALMNKSRPLRILVADDDQDTVLSLTMLLEEAGHEVKGTQKGEEVVSHMRHFDPDAVLLDIGMPDRNGYDVARLIRKRSSGRRPLLIAVTAWNKASDRMLAELAGFDHHLAKPYDPKTLLSLLHTDGSAPAGC